MAAWGAETHEGSAAFESRVEDVVQARESRKTEADATRLRDLEGVRRNNAPPKA